LPSSSAYWPTPRRPHYQCTPSGSRPSTEHGGHRLVPSLRRNARRPTCRSGPGTVRRCSPTGGPTRCWSGETSRSTADAASASARSPPRYLPTSGCARRSGASPEATAGTARLPVLMLRPIEAQPRNPPDHWPVRKRAYLQPKQALPSAAPPASRTRVRNQRRTTRRASGFCNTSSTNRSLGHAASAPPTRAGRWMGQPATLPCPATTRPRDAPAASSPARRQT
jgi:hypothetical protein